jgi:hypothetical protein
MTPPVPKTQRNGAPKRTTKSTGATPPPLPRGNLEVDLPAGGRLALKTPDEVNLWQESARKYIADYGISKTNDLVLLGAILSQNIAMYRAQLDLGDPRKANAAVTLIGKTSEQIRELEKALGIDKKTREAGGQHTVADYVTRLKRAAHAKGVRIADRVQAYEAFNMELRWKLRLLRNGDDEDRAYHNLSPESICAWAERELAKLEEADKNWAMQKGKVFVGRL